MKDAFAACDLRYLDLESLKTRFFNRPVLGIALVNDGKSSLTFSYVSQFYSGDDLMIGNTGYLCVFERSFLPELLRKKVLQLSMFALGKSSEYHLSVKDYEKTLRLFEKMTYEQNSSYQYKFDLIRTYLAQIIHLVMKMDRSLRQR